MTPLVEVTALKAHKEIFIWGADARAHRLARLCRLSADVKIEAMVLPDETTASFSSSEAPALPCDACWGLFLQAEKGDIALLCDGPLPQNVHERLSATQIQLYESRFTLNLFFPPPSSDHLLNDIAFLRLWNTMLSRRGVAAATRAQDNLPHIVKAEYDAVTRPHYAYAMIRAATEASLLGIKSVSVVEFGVAGGNGLLALEENAAALEKEMGVSFEIYGFDGGQGLPAPQDYRDQPYLFSEGDYPMDEGALRQRLSRSNLILGPLSQTASRFWQDHPDAAPLGAVMFDLDYYSSTLKAFELLDNPSARRLPRTVCYFDDISWSCHVHDIAGELKAIADFNASHDNLKLTQSINLAHTRVLPAPWNDQIYVLHDFAHVDYAKPLRQSMAPQRLDLF